MTLRTLAPTGALLLLLAAPALLIGCDSTSSDPAMATLAVDPMVGGNAFQAGQPFQINGTTGQLDVAQFYLSGITLIHEDGREITIQEPTPFTVRAKDASDNEIQHTVDDLYVLVDADAGRTTATLGEVPSGRYTGIRFMVGVDGLDNRIAPEDVPTTSALAPQSTPMHWNWNAGYVFVRLDGLLDIDGDGTVDASTGTPRDATSGQWRLHAGNVSPETVTINEAFELDGGEQETIRLTLDLATLVQGFDLGDETVRWCMTGGCEGVVTSAMSNASSAFDLDM